MTPEEFFQGRLVGWGVVNNPFGVILRRFQIQMEGSWSEEHRALHLDETYTYEGGDSHQRRWAIHTDEQGHILGHDAIEAARLRGRRLGRDFQVTFDRLRGFGPQLLEPVHVVRFVEVDKEKSLMLGKVRRWGVMIASTYVALRRIS